ncbi:Poly(A) polymerase [Giardia muris]|uniref:Poly(A) polymerase n=1 Tax=Giardia muris TaxID=5742 RepID=A0A4Z1SWJ4_GIAMU|nr:Poly(A) polymerase [Giardia muris]|eukprot:TNJ27898.1 Poly(A) polymerase [Giardia muris]
MSKLLASTTTGSGCPLELLPHEARLFQLVKDVVIRYTPSTILRVAGGWIRDKLLGKTSHDIDIAIDNLTGEQFGLHVLALLRERGEEIHTLSVIQANPTKSKHLESVHLVIYDIEVDFVNLRKEVYEADSRIPQMEFGTPLDDALRRDFTINSLFYNITTGEIEDFTGHGLEDLTNGIIRTPLPATDTFFDDPLRILRCVRFAKRLGYTIDKDIYEATKSSAVTSRLSIVSRQRYAKELQEILGGDNVLDGLRLLNELNVFNEVFVRLLLYSGGYDTLDDLDAQKTLYGKVAATLRTSVDTLKKNQEFLPDNQACFFLLAHYSISSALEDMVGSSVTLKTAILEDQQTSKKEKITMPTTTYVTKICSATGNSVAAEVEAMRTYQRWTESSLALDKHYGNGLLLCELHATKGLTAAVAALAASKTFNRLLHTELKCGDDLSQFLSGRYNVQVQRVAEQLDIKDKTRYTQIKRAALTVYFTHHPAPAHATAPFDDEFWVAHLEEIRRVLQLLLA